MADNVSSASAANRKTAAKYQREYRACNKAKFEE